MHDPMTVAFDIKNPFTRGPYRSPLLTIWHVDPEKDGSDDSCGWFPRSRHGDEKTLKEIEQAFAFEWSHGIPFGWFAENGEPNYSCHAIALGMFRIAANKVFGHWTRRADRFLNRHLHDILHFAENNCDSMFTFIQQSYGRDEKEDKRIKQAAAMVYGWIIRADRPWYKHPRWHFWHWKLQWHPLTNLKRWLFSRCCKCGRGFKYGESPVTSNWNAQGPRWFRSELDVYHSDCQSVVCRG